MQSDKMATPAENTAAPTPKKAAPKKAAATKKTVKKAAPKKATAPDTTSIKKTTKAAAKKTAASTPKPAPATAKKTAAKTPAKTAKSSTTTRSGAKIQLRFEIFFSTKFGETMLISGAHPQLGAALTDQAPVMEYIDHRKWAIHLTIDRASLQEQPLIYNYLVRYEDGSFALSAPYQLQIPANQSSVTIRDAWNAPGFIENAFSTDALQAFVAATTEKPATGTKKKYSHRFIVTAPVPEAGKAICLIGEDPALGGWAADKAIVLTEQGAGRWSTDLLLSLSEPVSAYKYGIYDLATGQLESFEAGDNRILEPDPTGSKFLILQNGFIRTN